MKKTIKALLLVVAISVCTCAFVGCSIGDFVNQLTCEHDFSISEEIIDSTCTEKGSITMKCSLCGKLDVKETALKEHTVQIIPGQAATCTKDGYTESSKCSVCDKVLANSTVVPKGHKEVVLEKVEATCLVPGLTEGKQCLICKEILVEQNEIPALGHDIVEVEAKEATCTEAGYTAGQKCSACDYLVSSEAIPALGHTTSTFGETCTRCNTVIDLEAMIACEHTTSELEIGHSLASGYIYRLAKTGESTAYFDIDLGSDIESTADVELYLTSPGARGCIGYCADRDWTDALYVTEFSNLTGLSVYEDTDYIYFCFSGDTFGSESFGPENPGNDFYADAVKSVSLSDLTFVEAVGDVVRLVF